jgi:hypothetical protein
MLGLVFVARSKAQAHKCHFHVKPSPIILITNVLDKRPHILSDMGQPERLHVQEGQRSCGSEALSSKARSRRP